MGEEKEAVVSCGSSKDKAWHRLVERSRHDPLFVGWALGQYAAVHGLVDDQVLKWLECRTDQRDHLTLCRMPDPEEGTFSIAVRRIAQFVDCNPDKLVQLLREVGALGALREGDTGSANGLLMAARDRKDAKGSQEKGG